MYRTLAAAAATVCAFGGAASEALGQDAPATRLAPVVVTATRTEVAPFDVPASIDRIGGDAIRDGRRQVDLSESLGGVPGLIARDRQNHAQDVQISVRGFGARSTFGIRGVRLYVDGIPATLPDGQGQISHVDLGSADRIEILRGPFSALYGNSSGGVLQVFTEEGSGPPALAAQFGAGSDGMRRIGSRASGMSSGVSYVLSASRFETDGYRDHSAAEREVANAKLVVRPDADSKLTFLANSLALPKAQDPLGLSRAQFDADPRSVDPSALAFDTRKTVDQTQLGALYERRVDAVHAWRALVYTGHRNTEQFQAIPVAVQANPLHPGGVILLNRDYSGADLRWTSKFATVTVVGGFAYDTLTEHRQGRLNFIGTTLGVEGTLRRDEINEVSNFDPYLQASWRLSPRVSLDAGVRRSSVRFTSSDRYVVGPNPDDSGRVSYRATLPVVGLLYAATDDIHLYATAGRGFETPTLNELAYRPNGATGLNLTLQPARSDSQEIGVKTRDAAWGDITIALFETRTTDEIVTQTNFGGRSTYQNAGATRRRGIEAGWSRQLGGNVQAQASWSWIDARYRDAYKTCTAAPCAIANATVPAGNRIPGVARTALYGSLAWAPPSGWRGGLEARALGRVAVNDLNSDAAAGYATVSAFGGYTTRLGPWEVGGFARIDNLAARRYAGSVIVNEGNARYFEPAPGRTWTVGVRTGWAFR